jgi:hypothetical protein
LSRRLRDRTAGVVGLWEERSVQLLSSLKKRELTRISFKLRETNETSARTERVLVPVVRA